MPFLRLVAAAVASLLLISPDLFVTSSAWQLCNVRDFGAKGDGHTDDTAALRSAVAACKTGGRILLPAPGVYLSGNLNLTHDNQELHIEGGATLLATTKRTAFPLMAPLPSYGWSQDVNCFDPKIVKYKIAIGKLRHAPVVGAYNVTNITLSGQGTIDGQGGPWWNSCFACTHEKRLEECLDGGRPKLVETQWVQGLHVKDLTLQNSPFWTLTPSYSQDIVIEGLHVYAPWNGSAVIGNTDGINIDSCRNVLIQNCVINNGDDGVSVKSGLNSFGYKFGVPTENVLVRNITCLSTSRCGFAVGSEMSGGIRNVTFENSRLLGQRGIHIKTSPGRGGFVRDVSYRSIDAEISLGTTYGGGPPDGPKPTIDNLLFEDISGPCSFHCQDTVSGVCGNLTFVNDPKCKASNTPPKPAEPHDCVQNPLYATCMPTPNGTFPSLQACQTHSDKCRA